jgi:hypothetical protein
MSTLGNYSCRCGWQEHLIFAAYEDTREKSGD